MHFYRGQSGLQNLGFRISAYLSWSGWAVNCTCHFLVSFWPSEIRDHPAREKIRVSGSFIFTDRPALDKYAYLRASSGVGRRGSRAQRALRPPFSRDFLNIWAFGLSFCREFLNI